MEGLFGGLAAGLAAGLVGGLGGLGGVARCVFDSGKPLPGPVSGSIKPFLAI